MKRVLNKSIVRRLFPVRRFSDHKIWNVDEINNEIEELMGNFSSVNLEIDKNDNDANFLVQQSTNKPSFNHQHLHNTSHNSNKTVFVTPKIQKSKNILLLSTSTLSTHTSSSFFNDSNESVKVQSHHWNGNVSSLLSHLNSAQYDGVIVANSQPIDSNCENVLKLVQKMSPVVVVNFTQNDNDRGSDDDSDSGSDRNRNSNQQMKYLSGFDLKNGIQIALQCLDSPNDHPNDNNKDEKNL